jgi:hypothetical protein
MKIKVLLSVIIFSLLVISTQSATYAMDPVSPSVSPQMSPIVTIENKEIQYDLPYPGLLPDSPLYSLKVFRDKLVEFFISDPSKKADYELLQSDKRINASVYLSNEKPVNDALISSTISKSINYFEQAITQSKLAQKQGNDMKSFMQHLHTASQKYNSIFLQLETKASDKLKNDLKADEKRVELIQNNELKMEKK